MSELNCPYCQNPFPKFPDRKSKCKTCRQFVYPKRRLEDPAQVKVLLTELQANDVECAWREQQVKAQLIESLKPTGITFEQLQAYAETDTNIEDIVFQGLKHCLQEYLIDDLNARAFAYHLLGNLVWKRDDKDASILFHKHGYTNTAKSIGIRVAVVPSLKLMLRARPFVCTECQIAVGVVEVDDYLQKPILPLDACAELTRTRGQGCLSILPHSDSWP